MNQSGKKGSQNIFSRVINPEFIPVYAVAVLLLSLYLIHPDLRSSKYVLELTWLHLVLSTVVLLGVSIPIAYLSLRIYLQRGFINVFLLGCGILLIGSAYFVVGWMARKSLNYSSIMYNIGVLCASFLYYLSALSTVLGASRKIDLSRKKLIAVSAYIGILMSVGLLTVAVFYDVVPPLFIPGQGPTALRQGILAIAVTLQVLSAAMMMGFNSERKIEFVKWVIVALLLTAMGTVGIALGSPGSPLNWVGRAANLMGGLYLIYALMVLRRIARRKGIGFEQAWEDFSRESGPHYKALVNMATSAIVATDHEGRILLWNLASEKIFGYTSAEAVGLKLEDMIVPKPTDSRFKQMLSGDSLKGVEMELRKEDGTRFPAEISFSSDERSDESSIRTIIIQDVTERKLAERDLLNARDQLFRSEKLASIGRLSAGVAHEILNPINIISVELQILQTMENLSPEVLEELKVCMAQISRIVAIAEDLKQFSSIPEKKMIMSDINGVIARVLTLYATQLKIEGIETEVQYQPDLPVIAMDREKIEQVILNLITNAVAAMEGEEIKVLRITTERETMFGKNDQLKIMIADTGMGIKSEHMSKIFDPFFTTKGEGKGTGLGLSISYGIIHDHGGSIWAENNELGGASFCVRLPVKTDIEKNQY
jgi:PAS domain S-box-containing protein